MWAWAVGDEGVILHHDDEVPASLRPPPTRRPPTPLSRCPTSGGRAGQRLGGRHQGPHLRWDGRAWDDVPARLSRRRESPGGVHRKSERRVVRGRAQLVVPRARRRFHECRDPWPAIWVPVQDIHGTAASDIWAVAGGVSSERRSRSSATSTATPGLRLSRCLCSPPSRPCGCGRCRPRTSGCGWGRC